MRNSVLILTSVKLISQNEKKNDLMISCSIMVDILLICIVLYMNQLFSIIIHLLVEGIIWKLMSIVPIQTPFTPELYLRGILYSTTIKDFMRIPYIYKYNPSLWRILICGDFNQMLQSTKSPVCFEPITLYLGILCQASRQSWFHTHRTFCLNKSERFYEKSAHLISHVMNTLFSAGKLDIIKVKQKKGRLCFDISLWPAIVCRDLHR